MKRSMQNIEQIITLNQQQKIKSYYTECEFKGCRLWGYNKNVEICKKCNSIMCGYCMRTDFNGCLNCLKLKCYICKIERDLEVFYICHGCNGVFCSFCPIESKMRRKKNNLSYYELYCENCAKN